MFLCFPIIQSCKKGVRNIYKQLEGILVVLSNKFLSIDDVRFVGTSCCKPVGFFNLDNKIIIDVLQPLSTCNANTDIQFKTTRLACREDRMSFINL